MVLTQLSDSHIPGHTHSTTIRAEHRLRMLRQKASTKNVSGSEHQQLLTRRSSKIISDADSVRCFMIQSFLLYSEASSDFVCFVLQFPAVGQS